MASGTFVAYYRVSTAKQGASGLGLDAQRAAALGFLNGGAWMLAAEFTETESGKNNARAELAKALAACRLYGARLLIAKLDRLSRDAAFLLSLRDAGVDFVAADMPNANRLTVGIMAMVAEAEREAISARTKAALAAAKARGVKLGGRVENLGETSAKGHTASLVVRKAKAQGRAADLAPVIAELRAEGITSLRSVAAALTAKGIPTARGAADWSPVQVSRLLAQLGEVMQGGQRGA